MKIIRTVMAVLLVICTIFSITIGYKKIGENKVKSTESYKGIITMWQIDGFEGGSGSRKQFLLSVARDFEKQNVGALVMVINHTFTSAKESISQGIYPDIISYSNGLDVKNMLPLNTSRSAGGGKVGQKTYASAWCRGGYVLIKNLDAIDKEQNSVIVSNGKYTQPLLAMHLEGLEFEKIEVLSPMDAYTKFTLGKTSYFLGTQRDVVRLTNRGFNFSISPLTSFNDLYQYVALTSSDNNKEVLARRFINYLLSNSVQEKLNKINMLSPYVSVGFDVEFLNQMQNINKFSTISAFYPSEMLLEIKDRSLLALNGDKNAEKYVKNLLI